jgi:DNA polymerase
MKLQPRIHKDFESRSTCDIKLGADVYARHYTTSPIMLSIHAPHVGVSYVIDFMAIPGYQQSIYPFAKPGDLNFRMIKPPCPPVVLQGIAEGWISVAHNARFEQAIWYHICHKQWGWPMPPKWSCTAARARYWGLRASLDGAASDLEVVHQKNEAGKQFINDFCKPRKYKGAKKLGIIKDLWYEPQDNPQGWAIGLKYCHEDALAECDIDDILPDLPEFEQAIWDLDFKLNTRGLPIDLQGVSRAIQFADHYTAVNTKRFDEITALRPTQRDRVLEYINQREEIAETGALKNVQPNDKNEDGSLANLRSKNLKRIVRDDLPADLQEVIDIRLETTKASIKKLWSMEQRTDDDGFARGIHLYFGAHTGRWSHKGIQSGNFTRPNPDNPQTYLFDFLEHKVWDCAHEMPQQPAWIAEAGIKFMRPLSYLSTSMRGFIKAPPGYKIVSGDYAQIEVRTNVWVARCQWVMDAFRMGQDVYVKFAADHMYHDNYDDYFEYKGNERSVRKTHKLKRQKAKSAELGCGYQVSGRGFVEYCDNVDLIITQEEGAAIVRQWREAHPEIADYNFGTWARAERAAILATTNEGQSVQLAGTNIRFHVHRLDAVRYWLICTLPSGRHIAYYRPKVRLGVRFGRTVEKLSFRTEWHGKSYREDTYGGKLIENIVQAIARDVCAVGALNVEAAGYPVIGLVHDEIISLPPVDFGSHQDMTARMCSLPAWVTDLPVEADGATMQRYGK